MDIKEEFTNQFLVSLGSDLSAELLAHLKNKLCMLLVDYDIQPARALPSVDVVNYSYVVQHFLTSKKIEGVSSKTIETYTGHLKRFFSDVKNQLPLAEITTNHIRRYLGILTNGGASAGYIDDVRIALNIFFRFCTEEDYISSNPVSKIKKIKQHKVIETPFSDMETAKLKDACITPREVALVDFLLSTGIRREEIVKIRMDELNLSERSVLIHGKGAKDRMVYFSAQTELALRKYIDSKKKESEYLFGKERGNFGQLTVSSLRDVIQNVAQRSGVANVHLHRFRKTFATYMINHGVAIQDLKEMMGHNSISTTNEYYAFANMDNVKSKHLQFAA